MPMSIFGEVHGLPDASAAHPGDHLQSRPSRLIGAFSAGETGGPSDGARGVTLQCPSCGSAHVAQVLGDNGGISFVCTACGHSWS
ncbi:hypothetical protein [Streptomyces sp. NPDC003077]|uniref:hypothetical protein n=1 Tax=Streptomyces sp. NPDC003077 TaxID=3154443 RepID=UPI0033B7EB20